LGRRHCCSSAVLDARRSLHYVGPIGGEVGGSGRGGGFWHVIPSSTALSAWIIAALAAIASPHIAKTDPSGMLAQAMAAPIDETRTQIIAANANERQD
jgi:hypothetical protein